MGLPPISSDSNVFNQSSIGSLIAALTLMLSVNGIIYPTIILYKSHTLLLTDLAVPVYVVGDEPKSSLDPKTGPLMVLDEERQLLR